MIKDLEERIIFKDQELIVVDKPFDTPTSGRNLEDNDCLQYWLIKRNQGMVWALHQLDADTTGINIFVTKKELVSHYKGLLEKENALKEYMAIVHGTPNWDEIEEHGSIGKVNDRSLGICADGKSAHSKFTVIERSEKYTLIRAQILTGRTHQIRIHLSHLGHPLVGEEWYKSPPCKEHIRQALHCSMIYLKQTDQSFTSSLPADFNELLKKLGFRSFVF